MQRTLLWRRVKRVGRRNEFTSRRTRTGALCTAECSSGGFNCAWCRSKDRQLCGDVFGTWLSWSETHQSVSVCAVPKFSWKSVPDLDFGGLLLSLSHEGLLRVIWATIDNVVVLSACLAVAFLNQNPLLNYSFYFIIKNIQVCNNEICADLLFNNHNRVMDYMNLD